MYTNVDHSQLSLGQSVVRLRRVVMSRSSTLHRGESTLRGSIVSLAIVSRLPCVDWVRLTIGKLENANFSIATAKEDLANYAKKSFDGALEEVQGGVQTTQDKMTSLVQAETRRVLAEVEKVPAAGRVRRSPAKVFG